MKFIFKLFGLLAVLSTIFLGFGSTAHAAPTSVNPDDPRLASLNNSLMFGTSSKYQSTLNSVSSSNSLMKTYDYKVPVDGTTNRIIWWPSLNDLKKTDTITIDYSKGPVGFYDGKEINCKFILSDFYVQPNIFGLQNNGHPFYIDINHDLPQGFTTSGISHFKLTAELTYRDSGERVDLKGDSFITFNSLNGRYLADSDHHHREFVSYNQMGTQEYFVTKDTGLGEYTDLITGSGKVVGGVTKPDTDDKFEDLVGAKTFTNGSVSFNVKGKDLSFQIGNTGGTQWVAFNASTLWNARPVPPKKTGEDNKGNNIDNEQVKIGDEIIYKVPQTINTLNQDLLTKYTAFEMVDNLPAEVTYKSAKVVRTSDNKVISEAGKDDQIKIDGQTVTFKASSDTLNKVFLYNGETYVLEIHTVVNDKAKPNQDFKNQAKVIINGNSENTNFITNHIPKNSTIEKGIVEGDKLVKDKDVNYDEKIPYQVDAAITDWKGLSQVQLVDKLEPVLKYVPGSAKVLDADKKEVKGKITEPTSANGNTLTFDAASPADLKGKKITLYFEATLIEGTNYVDYVVDGKIVIPNKATLNTNFDKKTTPEVNVTPPPVEAKAIKKIDISDSMKKDDEEDKEKDKNDSTSSSSVEGSKSSEETKTSETK